MPSPEELFRRLQGAMFLSKLDLRSGFWQIRLSPEAQNFCGRLHFIGEASRMHTLDCPLGMLTSLLSLSMPLRLNCRLSGVVHSAVFVTDVVIGSDNFEQHLQDLSKVLHHFHSVSLKAHTV